MARTE